MCYTDLTNWSFGIEVVNFVSLQERVDTTYYQPDGEWNLTGSAIQKFKIYQIKVVSFSLYLQRKPTLYILNIIVPTAVMSMISVLVFPLPAESGEKISLSISVLLSYSVLMLKVADIMPNNAKFVPISVSLIKQSLL